MTRVVYVGNTRVDWCTEVHIGRALVALGCDLKHLQEDEQTPGSIEREAIDFDADMVLYTRTWGQPPALIDVWRRLEARGIVTASYHLDLYLGLKREDSLFGDPFWATQYVFTPDGDPASQTRFEQLGINHHWMPPAVVHDECVMGRYLPDLAHDVVFVGSENYHPEWSYRPQLVAWLRRQYPNTFARYGAGGTVIRGQRLNDLYRSAKVAVGDSLCPGFTKPRYWSDRVCETLGRGGVLIHPDVPGLRDYMGLEDGVHCMFYTFNDFDTLGDKIRWAIGHPDEARAIAAHGQRHIRDHHTYLDRLAAALHTVGLRDTADRPPYEPETTDG